MNKPILRNVSADVPTRPQMSPTGQDRTGQERTGPLNLQPLVCSNVVATTRGSQNLREYLNAPSHVQDAFDRRIRQQIEADLASERYIAAQESDDPIAPAPPERGIPSRTTRWDASWTKRAKFHRTPGPGAPEPYNRDTDPLLDLDLREVWEQLTGEDLRHDRSRCPHPDHEDMVPACRVYADGWRCFACGRYGSIIDLGSALYRVEPFGKGFFDIRRSLLSDLGIEGREAA